MKKRGGISDQLKNNNNSISGTWDMQLSMCREGQGTGSLPHSPDKNQFQMEERLICIEKN